MPVKRFWFLYRNSLRIEALDDLRQLRIAVNTGGMEVNVEGIKDMQTNLSSDIGKIVEFDPADLRNLPDPDARQRLRNLASPR